MTDLGALNYFLGISAVRHSTGLFLSQRKYALQLLERAHMVNCNPSRTPVDTESKLGPNGVPVQDPTMYRRLGTLDLGLHLYASPTTSLVGYTDADWTDCPSTPRFTLGYCVFLDDNLLSWSGKRQHTLSCSSAEAEYRGVANVVTETACLCNLIVEYTIPLSTNKLLSSVIKLEFFMCLLVSNIANIFYQVDRLRIVWKEFQSSLRVPAFSPSTWGV
ncbi:ribonuclease H-like domain-containing protein [Tanacetum coccineum]